jgi:hypothetical protein
MRLEAVSKPEGDAEKCPTCGGGICRRPYGEMHAGSFIRDGERVDIRAIPKSGFGDPIYLDAGTQYFDGGLYRLWPSETYFANGSGRLHRKVWIAAFGAIPKGCHIHHRDDDPTNNLLANLECIPAKQHLSETWERNRERRAAEGHFSQKAKNAAREWHQSDAGRLWHSRQAKRSKSWTKWKREPRECLQCSKTFDALIRKSGHPQVYCSTACKVAAYRGRKLHNKWAADYRERQRAKPKG